MSLDVDRVSKLLEITERCALHTGKLTAISTAALSELTELNGELHKVAVKAAEQRTAAEAKADVPLTSDVDDTPDENRPGGRFNPTIADRRV